MNSLALYLNILWNGALIVPLEASTAIQITVEGVIYVMYYDGSFAIHGAYWHDNFGERVSSGCVNLPVDEAAWYYAFAEIGTQVVIQHRESHHGGKRTYPLM